MLEVILCFKLCKCHQQSGGKCLVESGFAVCKFRKPSYFGKCLFTAFYNSHYCLFNQTFYVTNYNIFKTSPVKKLG